MKHQTNSELGYLRVGVRGVERHSNSAALSGRTAMLAALAMLGLSGCSALEGAADILIPKPAEFIPALIAFIVIWVVLAKFVWPSVIQTMDARERKIQEDLACAAQAKEEACAKRQASEEKLAEVQRKATTIIVEAQRQAKEERAAILAKAHKEAAAQLASAHEAIEEDRQKAMIELSVSVVDLSVEIASKIIGNNLSLEDQRKLAERYLAEIGTEDDGQSN